MYLSKTGILKYFKCSTINEMLLNKRFNVLLNKHCDGELLGVYFKRTGDNPDYELTACKLFIVNTVKVTEIMFKRNKNTIKPMFISSTVFHEM